MADWQLNKSLCLFQSNPTHQDLNTKAAWAQGYTGRGVVVTILDDGIEKDHPDLISNYVSHKFQIAEVEMFLSQTSQHTMHFETSKQNVCFNCWWEEKKATFWVCIFIFMLFSKKESSCFLCFISCIKIIQNQCAHRRSDQQLFRVFFQTFSHRGKITTTDNTIKQALEKKCKITWLVS